MSARARTRSLLLGLLLALPAPLSAPLSAQEAAPDTEAPPPGETIVAGLSQNRIAIKANFSGSEIMIYGAVRREAPPPEGQPLHVIITIEGPPSPLTVRRKDRVAGIWINDASIRVDSAPSFYAVASTGPVGLILSRTEDQRHRITLPGTIRTVGASAQADNPSEFVDALLRIYEAQGRYRLSEDVVRFSEATLFRSDVVLPANLTEGDYRVRIFLVRGGKVIDTLERRIGVRKEGLERSVYNLAHDKPLAYAAMAILIALFAGWSASEIFRRLRL